jgi:hypothetical protein
MVDICRVTLLFPPLVLSVDGNIILKIDRRQSAKALNKDWEQYFPIILLNGSLPYCNGKDCVDWLA